MPVVSIQFVEGKPKEGSGGAGIENVA